MKKDKESVITTILNSNYNWIKVVSIDVAYAAVTDEYLIILVKGREDIIITGKNQKKGEIISREMYRHKVKQDEPMYFALLDKIQNAKAFSV